MKVADGVRRVGLFLLALGAAMFVGTVVHALAGCSYYGSPLQVVGKVVRFEDEEGRTRVPSAEVPLYPVVEYQAPVGVTHTTRPEQPQSPSEIAIGEAVKVSYLEAHPDRGQVATGANLFSEAMSWCVASNVAFMMGFCIVAFETIVSYFNRRWRGQT